MSTSARDHDCAPAASALSGLRLAPPPTVSASKRDPVSAVELVRTFYEGRRASAVTEHELAALPLPDQVAATAWYHTIELPGGIVTPGMFDHRPLVPHYGIPVNLAGMRCLDAACANGFWAFEFERRGGDVVAVDIPSIAEWDFPAGTPKLPDTPSGGPDQLSTAAFNVAHQALGSRVRLVRRNVYALDAAELGTFDFVHAADVLVHLRDPLAALAALRNVTAPGGSALLVDVFDPTLHGAVSRYLGGFDALLWWTPSIDCLVQMVHDAGFAEVDVLNTYTIAAGDDDGYFWRAIIRART